MATSLLEAENVEPEIPLHARSTTELLQRFKASMTLAQVLRWLRDQSDLKRTADWLDTTLLVVGPTPCLLNLVQQCTC